MCGIAGCIEISDLVREDVLHAMAEQLRARGPDSSGVWCDPLRSVGLAHRRLSILDLSSLGHQPMHSPSGRYTITFNGEIFNYRELANQIDHPLRGGSDTEVMLAAFEKWGVLEAVTRFTGMFAFAVWDAGEQSLTLVRDRMGIKPIYYGWSGNTFLFGSEIKALRAHPAWCPEISMEGVSLFTRFGYVPAPWSIYGGIWKVPPGTLLTLSLDDLRNKISVSPWPNQQKNSPRYYWSLEEKALAGMHDPVRGSEKEILDDLEARIYDAVKMRMISDVPLGAFLSGGIDSSLVVAMMQRAASSPVHTFSIGFGAGRYNEAPFARAVSEHLKTDHTEIEITSQMALEFVPELAHLCDEPFGDSSIIPTYFVSKLARTSATVALSGDGGDELFGGYDRYTLLNRLASIAVMLPAPVRRLASAAAHRIPNGAAEGMQIFLRRLGLFPFDLHNATEKTRRTLSLLTAGTPRDLYFNAIQHWLPEYGLMRRGLVKTDPCNDLSGALGASTLSEFSKITAEDDLRAFMAIVDQAMYLPDDILTKVDRASMACSLEARVPLLDHRLVEFSWRIPTALKYRDGRGKWPLRELARRYVPAHLIDRPKRGFAIPLDDWLRGPLKEWAEELLSRRALEQSGVFVEPVIRRAWDDHMSGRRNISQQLWNVVMFQAWHREAFGIGEEIHE